MPRDVAALRIGRWPSTWALVAALSLATFVLLLRSCAVVGESIGWTFARLRAEAERLP